MGKFQINPKKENLKLAYAMPLNIRRTVKLCTDL
jgi:hypothetical protein